MPKLLSLSSFAAATLAALSTIGTSAEARASDAMASKTLQAIVRSLGFLDSAPKDGRFTIGIVYAAELPDARAIAIDAGNRLDNLPGPKRTRIHATAYSVEGLLQARDRIDALLLVPGLESESALVADLVRQRRILSVSSDRGCLAAGSCVLMVNADRDVEIVLDTALAALVGAQFSNVFTMMVTRQ